MPWDTAGLHRSGHRAVGTPTVGSWLRGQLAQLDAVREDFDRALKRELPVPPSESCTDRETHPPVQNDADEYKAADNERNGIMGFAFNVGKVVEPCNAYKKQDR